MRVFRNVELMINIYLSKSDFDTAVIAESVFCALFCVPYLGSLNLAILVNQKISN